MKTSPRPAIGQLIERHRVVVCVGSGGVGKTTTSAVIGLHAALEGRKVLVLTIDPARRLANSLGLEELGHDMRQIPLERFRSLGLEPKGELWAMMLDMKQSFDRLVRSQAPDAKTAEEILDNRFYQYFSTSLAGTQEYAASERLYELYHEGEFDLIVLDTPPTTHALDFLEAPYRLADALSSRALQWLYKPALLSGRSGLFSVGTSYVMKTLGRFTGTELLEELSVFLRTFSTLFEGIERRARAVQSLLTGPGTTFVVVTAPEALTIDEALYFYGKLGEQKLGIGAFVVNRVHPQWVDADLLDAHAPAVRQELEALLPHSPQAAGTRSLAERLVHNAQDLGHRARQDQENIARLRQAADPAAQVVTVPYFNQDIHSLEGLNRARQALFQA